MIRDVVAGQVFVNTYGASGGVELPFGGFKRSGHGREKGAEGLRGFAQPQDRGHRAVMSSARSGAISRSRWTRPRNCRSPSRDERLDTPAMLIDLDVVDANIARFAQFAKAERPALRPHAKTHKSIAMARRQLAEGAAGVAVSRSPRQQALAAAGITDILLAYPLVGSGKLQRAASLLAGASSVSLVSRLAEVIDGYQHPGGHAGPHAPVLVEVDTGMHRVGASPADVLKLAAEVARGPAGCASAGSSPTPGTRTTPPSQLGIEAWPGRRRRHGRRAGRAGAGGLMSLSFPRAPPSPRAI